MNLAKKITPISSLDLLGDNIFKIITDNSNDMIHFNDVDGTIIYVNPVTHKLLGYEPDEIINEPAENFVHPDDRGPVREDMGQLINGIDIPPREIRLIKKAGDMLDVEVKGFVVRESGKTKFIGAILRDISERKTGLQFKKAKEEWEEAFDTLSDFVSVHDENFKVVKVNKALCEFLNKTPEEIIGSHCYNIFHNLNNPVPGCPHDKAIDTGHPVTVDINDPYIGVPLQVTCSPFFDKEGAFKGSVHVARIITGSENRILSGSKKLVSICAWCKDIRQNDGKYIKMEKYIEDKTQLIFTHTMCKSCQKELYPKFVDKK